MRFFERGVEERKRKKGKKFHKKSFFLGQFFLYYVILAKERVLLCAKRFLYGIVQSVQNMQIRRVSM
jgi:hypothetical protein